MASKTIAIIPCTNQKSEVSGPARDVWIGNHFQLVLAHAEMFYDEVLIMSYKYGLIGPDFKIDPYDVDMRYSKAAERIKWWFMLKQQIIELSKSKPLLVGLYTGSFERERIMREFVRNDVKQIILPFEGLKVGERMSRVYDCIPPFDRALAEKGEYALPDNFGEGESGSNKYLPPPSSMTDKIEWED